MKEPFLKDKTRRRISFYCAINKVYHLYVTTDKTVFRRVSLLEYYRGTSYRRTIFVHLRTKSVNFG